VLNPTEMCLLHTPSKFQLEILSNKKVIAKKRSINMNMKSVVILVLAIEIECMCSSSPFVPVVQYWSLLN